MTDAPAFFDEADFGFGRTKQRVAPCLVPSEQTDTSTLVCNHNGSPVMLITSSERKERNRVDLSSKDLTRHWCKRLKKSKDEIEAAIAKVGDNAESVMKELGVHDR
jgi:hypothetical protein